MHIQKVCGGRSFWFGTNKYGQASKTISITFHLNRWKNPRLLWMRPRFNGAVKGKDACLDWNMEILGLHLSYTDWDYGRFKRAA